MRIAVTGAGGRLGQAMVRALAAAGHDPVRWGRAEFDLDEPGDVGVLLDATGPASVIHAAAWTDVDACALEPELAMQRNGTATGILAQATANRGVGLLIVSTNEVFDGNEARAPRPYETSDSPSPGNAYGASKLAGERAAAAAYGDRPGLGIARTAWLFGPGAPDFPVKIAAAARKAAAADQPLRVVSDEVGTPTYVEDAAEAITRLLDSGASDGIHHVVNAGVASRADWARDVLSRLEINVPIFDVGLDAFPRPSRPPHWGVMAASSLPGGSPLRDWREAMEAYEPALRQSVTDGS